MNVPAVALGLAGRIFPGVQVRVQIPGLKFPDALRAALGGLEKASSLLRSRDGWVHTVRKGETLSAICLDSLKQLGIRPTGRAIYEAVEKVARANGIRNPNLIHPGQKIDLSILLPSAAGLAPEKLLSTQAASPASAIGKSSGKPVLTPPPSAPQMTAAARPAVAQPPGGLTGAVLEGPAQPTSGYGLRKDPLSGHRRFHHGIDFAAHPGTSIRSLLPGRVVYSGWRPGYGNVVIVEHGPGFETLYAHNMENLVREGEYVSKGTALALVGSTGRGTGPHLHFEVRQYGRAVDPMPLLGKHSFHVAKAF